MDLKETVDKTISILNWYVRIEDDLIRIINLVQENPAFFDNPAMPMEESYIKVVADKLEELIKSATRKKAD